MAGKSARVDFGRCNPELCNPGTGACPAACVCTKRLLEQEKPFESPILISAKMCVGCGDCVSACALGAISIERSS